MTFKELPNGAHFAFVGEYGASYDWWYCIKTGDRTYEERKWRDGSGGEAGVVGVGDQIVVRKDEREDACQA